MDIKALNAYPIYDVNSFDPLIEMNNVFSPTKSQALSGVNMFGDDPWKTVVPDSRHKTNEYEGDVFEGIVRSQYDGQRSYEGIRYEYLLNGQFIDMKGTGMKKDMTSIAPKKFIKTNPKTGRKYLTNDVLSKY